MSRVSKVASFLALASTGLAQLPSIQPFTVTGSLDSCDATGTEYNAGGSITVNNFNIEVPQNLIVQLPVVFAPFRELCNAGALGFETTVVGNIVNGKVIAGQVSVAQRFGLEGSQGYISAINEDGTLQIASGPRVRINDPDGLFGPQYDSQKYWVADTASPSVTSFSGFPMCIPYSGNTAKCSSSNRPTGQTFTPQDPLAMVPFKVGDFIEYSGLKVGGEILASSIVCPSLHITTGAGAPNYIRVEDFLVGVPDNAANVEFADIRAIGFLSSCAGATVTISAIDVDPCTGKETYRTIGTTQPKQETRCKWEARIAPQAQAPFTREYRITTNTPVKETKDGIKAGQYIAAVSEWIFPEVDVPGTNPPPYPFNDIRGLVQGDFLNGKQYGPLSPFPGPSPPAPSKSCSPADIPDPNATPTPSPTPSSTPSPDTPTEPSTPQTAPIASIATLASALRVGTDVTLLGSNTATGLKDTDLNFVWTKTTPASPAISITNANSPSATFLAPKVTTETSFTFELTITSKTDATKSSKATVTVKINPTLADTVTLDTYTWESRQSGSITASCTSNVKNGDNKAMTLLINGTTRRTMVAVTGQPGRWTYSARDTARPTNVKCVSDLKGESAVRTATTTRRRRAFVA
ncbi:uncharacterized protein ALTATR162_LOCUS9564 [Alternaria atra]|uniref:Ig-like domain-containing protein n=1 Tax=Alternaria atra TaxID=119953 RepID=A0A8J2I7Y2_9PLEO|nr:uncharacterized protein ALTATR162_LOCUS9564 [Alternaria atra]CAG5181042.1 unnamed protein product [Alternaria atra]